MTADQQSFINSQKLTAWVKYGLYLQIIISVIASISGLMEYQLLTDYATGVYDSQEQAELDGIANDERQGVVGIIQVIIFIVSGVLILKWIHRANYNSRQLGAKDLIYTPGWSVGWYFVPIATLWKPFEAMKEIWKASHKPDDWQDVEVPKLLSWWWSLWIISTLTGNASFRLTLRAEELQEFINANLVTLVSDLSAIPLALIMMKVVSGIHQAQMKNSRLEGATIARQ